jgi:probable phosphomutase (TIGR03848 family)
MTVLLLVRHALTPATGRTLSGWTPGLHLSPQGLRQADELADRLAAIELSAIYSSPLERCRETAAPIARRAARPVQRRKSLGEVDYGDWTNRPLKQLMRTNLWKVVQGNPSAVRFPDGESLVECQSRMVSALHRIVEEHPDGTVAVFSHGDPIRLALAHFTGVHLDAFQRIAVSPASVSAIAIGHGVPRILKMNDTGSLAELAPPPSPAARSSAAPSSAARSASKRRKLRG